MPDTNDASEAARSLVAHCWGNQVAVRAAQTVIDRVAELPPAVREQVHEATGSGEEARDD
jgi:hypothetical protein